MGGGKRRERMLRGAISRNAAEPIKKGGDNQKREEQQSPLTSWYP